MKKLKKGEWYEFEGYDECLLQYNDGDYAKGWWNGNYGEKWHFSGIAYRATPASEKILKKYGVTKEMKEKKKLNFNWVYLLGGVVALISAVLALFNSDFIDAKLNLILCILFANLYRESAKVTMSVETKDLLRVINSDKFRNN